MPKKLETVSIVKVGSKIEEAVIEALSLIEANNIFDKRRRILIKPNLVRISYPGSGIITDYRVVRGVLEYLKENSLTDIIIGESSGKLTRYTLHAYKAGKYEKLGVPLIDLNNDEYQKASLGDIEVKISKLALDSDYIINIPVIKCHHRARVSISMKNLMGCLIGGSSKNNMHKEHYDGMPKNDFLEFEKKFAKRLINLNKIVKTDLVVVDGTVGREIERDGPKVYLGLIISGTNRVAVDATCCRLIGIDPYSVFYLKEAEREGLGPVYEGDIGVVGESINTVKKTFREKKFWRELKR